jgi:hypothetical protein
LCSGAGAFVSTAASLASNVVTRALYGDIACLSAATMTSAIAWTRLQLRAEAFNVFNWRPYIPV